MRHRTTPLMGWTAPERHLCAKLGVVEDTEREEPSAVKTSATRLATARHHNGHKAEQRTA
jgi:hypothetical protein